MISISLLRSDAVWTPLLSVYLSCSGVLLEKVCEYLAYNEKWKDAKEVPDMDIPPALCLELLMAADYLDC